MTRLEVFVNEVQVEQIEVATACEPLPRSVPGRQWVTCSVAGARFELEWDRLGLPLPTPGDLFVLEIPDKESP